MNENQMTTGLSASGISRRRFFGYAGALAGAGLLSTVTACNKDDDYSGIDLGTGDIGLLNYAYVLEQLQAAFYTQLFHLTYVGISPAEQAYLQDMYAHEIAHRELLKTVLGTNAVQMLTPNFSTVDFTNRASVLSTARTIEDLSVSAYNGAGKLFTNTAQGAAYLMLTAKIVSVEARHAAVVRELLQPDSFADTSIVDPFDRTDLARTPAEVLHIAGAYFYELLNSSNLPSF
jgi:hypothetical protein